MKLSVIGSVKIGSKWRKKLFIYNLESLKPISYLLSWRVNFVGKYADFAKKQIINSYPDAKVTIDDGSSYYEVTKNQLQNSQNDIILFWEEDNWFLCQDKNFFVYLLSEFKNSRAEMLSISHLIGSWQRKFLLPVVKENYLYREYKIDKDSQKDVWEKFPGAYIAEISAIYKKDLAMQILEFNKPYLIREKDAHQYELDRKKGEEFLQKRSFVEMVPTFHVFREVFKFKTEERVISIKEAIQILKIRQEKRPSIIMRRLCNFFKMASLLIPKFGPWPRIIRFGLPAERILKSFKKRIKKMTGL